MDRAVFDDGWSFDSEASGDVYVNPGQSALSLVQYHIMAGDEQHKGQYYSVSAAIPATAGTFSSSSYSRLTAPYDINNPVDPEFKARPVLMYQQYYNDDIIGQFALSNKIQAWPLGEDWWIGSYDALESLGLKFFPQHAVMGGIGYGYQNDAEASLGMVSYPVENQEGAAVQMAIPNTLTSLSLLDNYNSYGNWDGVSVWNPNPWFTMIPGRSKIKNGNSAPIMVAEACWYPAEVAVHDGIRSAFYHNYRGRNGEGRDIDFLNETYTVSINGVKQDFSGYPSIHTVMVSGENRYGTWDIDFVNNNVIVNGEKGICNTRVHFKDNINDVSAPTLQMLQTLDAEGNVTDDFNKAEDLKIVLAGADFEARFNQTTLREWFYPMPCDVKVEVAPAGTENWQELSVTENVERYFVPGWGYYWEVDGAQINVPAAKTKFSMRITLTDAYGNYQQQLVSPVFTISTASAINTIKAEMPGAEYFTLQGLRLNTPQKGQICIERSATGQTRKVIVR